MQEKPDVLRTYGDPVLRKRSKPVEAIDGEIRQICRLMAEVMIRENGLGLAAPQIGFSKRIFVLDVDGALQFFINPELIARSEEVDEIREGCLSVPGVDALVSRSACVVVEGLDLHGERVRLEAEGILARAVQHEMDHLDGNLFLDTLSAARRQSLVREYQRAQREEEKV